jgi:SAM-dependent methyltransferase
MATCEPLEATGNQSMTSVCQAILSSRGGMPRDYRILDFGCGLGRHVREFRAAGYEAVGVDRPNGRVLDGEGHLYSSDAQGKFPFASESFDFCYSTSVFEHVMDYDQAIGEICRVLRPGAWTLHVFPARWRPVEPHIFTPFGGRFQHPAIISLWAHLGIRNSFQKGLPASQTAARNLTYSRTGINYPPKREISLAFGRHFKRVEFVERDFVAALREGSRLSGLLAPVISWPGVEALYRGLHTRVVLARKLRRLDLRTGRDPSTVEDVRRAAAGVAHSEGLLVGEQDRVVGGGDLLRHGVGRVPPSGRSWFTRSPTARLPGPCLPCAAAARRRGWPAIPGVAGFLLIRESQEQDPGNLPG